MGRPLEEAEVREIQEFAEKNLAVGKTHIASYGYLRLALLEALCDSWLAQGRVIDALLQHSTCPCCAANVAEDEAHDNECPLAVFDVAAGGVMSTTDQGEK